MRSLMVRQHLVRAAALAASVALVAACGSPAQNEPTTTNDEAGTIGSIAEATAYPTGTLLFSDGTEMVTIGDARVKFPTTVTDAAWSPDGSRIAFINRNGNVATARPDGTDMMELTKAAPELIRSRPSWSRSIIFFAEKQRREDVSTLMSVPANGCGPAAPWGMDTGDGTSYVDLAPSSALLTAPRVAFQHEEPSGSEVWINDSNRRTPVTYKVVAGTEPALSPDGEWVAYVSGGTIFVSDTHQVSSTKVQLTGHVEQPTHLTWTPDGKGIAYQTPSGVQRVSADGSTRSSTPATLSPASGVPSYLGSEKDAVDVINGGDPIALAIAASQARWPSEASYAPSEAYRGAFGVTLSTMDSAAAVMTTNAGYGEPLLFTRGDSLDPAVRAELVRLFGVRSPGPSGPPIEIAGTDITPRVLDELRAMGLDPRPVAVNGRAPVQPGPNACDFQYEKSLTAQTVIVHAHQSATDTAVAWSLGRDWHAPVIAVDPAAGLSTELREYLARSAPSVQHVLIVDATGMIPDSQRDGIAHLVSGALGHTSTVNPKLPALP